jgi:hypothetical protein
VIKRQYVSYIIIEVKQIGIIESIRIQIGVECS